jgi:fructose-1,6-bisphosphatase/inositol monophosphatase family enzyme
MRQLIKQTMPHHSIFGEEHGLELGEGTPSGQSPDFLWVLDPIDGTKSFITGGVH